VSLDFSLGGIPYLPPLAEVYLIFLDFLASTLNYLIARCVYTPLRVFFVAVLPIVALPPIGFRSLTVV